MDNSIIIADFIYKYIFKKYFIKYKFFERKNHDNAKIKMQNQIDK